MNLYLKRFLLEGTLTGFVVGLVVSVATTGDLGAERAVFGFLVVPGITAALLTRLFQSKHPLSGKRPIVRLLFVAYLTTFPLFGLLAGGANVPLAALAGACFGTVWASLAVLVTSQLKGVRNGFAIASLLNGIVWIVALGIFPPGPVLALIFGYIALSQIKKDPSIGGRGMAIAGVVMGWIGVGILFLAVVL